MELIKKDDRWDLYNKDGHKIASTLDGCVNKLSLKNCQAIENGYDLDELALKFMIDESYGEQSTDLWKGYLFGFQKALSILGDKKFSEDDVRKAYTTGWNSCNNFTGYDENQEFIELPDCIQSLQQTEWEVSCNPDVKDADGNLILKRK